MIDLPAFVNHNDVSSDFTIPQNADSNIQGDYTVTVRAEIQVPDDYTQTTFTPKISEI